jgi:hypothetical protein
MAPSFPEIANDPATTRAGLRAGLFNPHPPMPKLDLMRREIDDLTAYILNLANNQSASALTPTKDTPSPAAC